MKTYYLGYGWQGRQINKIDNKEEGYPYEPRREELYPDHQDLLEYLFRLQEKIEKLEAELGASSDKRGR